MPSTDKLEPIIRRLQADYWARVDFIDPAGPEDLFTKDSTFELGSLVLHGREELGTFFRKRAETSRATGRTTRHLGVNLRIELLDERRLAASTTVMVMTGYGDWPMASGLPSVGDFNDVCVLEADGCWRFQRRTAASVFAGPDAPAFAQGPTASGGAR